MFQLETEITNIYLDAKKINQQQTMFTQQKLAGDWIISMVSQPVEG